MFASQNDVYSGSSSTTVRIDIPALANSFIDTQQSALRLRVNITGQDSTLDFSAACVIRSITVFSQGMGNQLETIGNYGLLSNTLLSVTSDFQTCEYANSVLMGSSESLVRQGATIAAGSSREFYLPLMSIMGLFSERALPAAGYTIQLQLEDSNLSFRSATTTAPTYTVDRIAYVASIHDVGPEIYGALMMANGGQTLIPASTYRSFESTVSTSSSQSFQIGVRASSIKGFIGVTRRNDALTTANTPSLSDCQSLGTLSSYQWRLGSEIKPQNPVTSYAGLFAELQKAYHTFNSGSAGMIDWSGFTRSAVYANATPAAIGSFAFGLDLEEASRQKTDTLLSGFNNTSGVNIFLDTTWSSGPVAGTLNVWAHTDLVLAFSGNNQVVAQI
jgi:hypothetical protein